MATRAMYLSVKMDADTRYFSLVQAVFDHMIFTNSTATVDQNNGNPKQTSIGQLKNHIDAFFSNQSGASITTTGEAQSVNTLAVTTSQTITYTSATIYTNLPYSTYFNYLNTSASAVNTLIGPYVRFKIASMTDGDYTAFVDKLRTNVKAAYPIDRVWNETNTPTA